MQQDPAYLNNNQAFDQSPGLSPEGCEHFGLTKPHSAKGHPSGL